MKNLPNPHRVALIPELPPTGGRLGRHIQFDERSRAYRVAAPKKATPLVTRLWSRTAKAFDQKSLGSCTGNGAAGLLVTAPYIKPRRRVSESTAIKIYSKASMLDAIQGSYPPADTGSSVLAAMQALKAMGYASAYSWCLGLQDALQTLSSVGPVEIGINWYEGFDQPDLNGRVRISGQVRGGHAFEVLGVDVEQKVVTAINSWGSTWGQRGRFTFSWDDFDRLLHEDGEAATITL